MKITNLKLSVVSKIKVKARKKTKEQDQVYCRAYDGISVGAVSYTHLLVNGAMVL